MKTHLLLSALLATALPCQVAAQDQPYQIVRAGDGEMTCDALATSINALNGEIEAAQRGAQNRQAAGRVGRGLLSGLARGASMFGGSLGGDGVAGAIAAQAVAGAAATVAESAGSAASAPAPAAPAASAPERRLQHLQGIFTSRSC